MVPRLAPTLRGPFVLIGLSAMCLVGLVTLPGTVVFSGFLVAFVSGAAFPFLGLGLAAGAMAWAYQHASVGPALHRPLARVAFALASVELLVWLALIGGVLLAVSEFA